MEENKYIKFISGHRNQNAAVSDEDMAKVTGGVGGKNEATCPVCGKPMAVVNNPYGDNYWTCSKCNIDQLFSDADYIEVIKICEMAGQTEGIVYPVWWDKVKNKKTK